MSSTARSAAYPRNGVTFGACERASVALSLKGELIPNHVMRPRPAVQHKSSRPAVAVFARAPEPGKVKTRLIPLLGSRGAAEFHSALIRDTLDKVCGESAASYLFLAGRWPHGCGAREAPNTSDQKTAFGADSLRTVAGRCPEIALFQQRGADLGKRLGAAFTRLLRDHPAAVVVGTDSPLMPRRLLREALRELGGCEAVLGPCPDGGYYLIAMRRGKVTQAAKVLHTAVFRDVRWGSRAALRDTLRNLLRSGVSCSILEPVADVDRPADVRRLREELTRSRAARRLAHNAWRFLESWGREL